MWHISMVVVVDLAVVLVRCIRRFAQNARRSAKFLSSLAKTVPYIARIVSQREKAVVRDFWRWRMKTKAIRALLLALALAVSVIPNASYAFEHGEGKGHYRDLEDKFFEKVHFLMTNREELGISDDQAGKVKALTLKVKKDMIKRGAEIEILALDLKTETGKDPVDMTAVNKLIDKKYDLKKEEAKSLAEACVTLKGILTKEQKAKMKGIWKKCKEEKMPCMCRGEREEDSI